MRLREDEKGATPISNVRRLNCQRRRLDFVSGSRLGEVMGTIVAGSLPDNLGAEFVERWNLRATDVTIRQRLLQQLHLLLTHLSAVEGKPLEIREPCQWR